MERNHYCKLSKEDIFTSGVLVLYRGHPEGQNVLGEDKRATLCQGRMSTHNEDNNALADSPEFQFTVDYHSTTAVAHN